MTLCRGSSGAISSRVSGAFKERLLFWGMFVKNVCGARAWKKHVLEVIFFLECVIRSVLHHVFLSSSFTGASGDRSSTGWLRRCLLKDSVISLLPEGKALVRTEGTEQAFLLAAEGPWCWCSSGCSARSSRLQGCGSFRGDGLGSTGACFQNPVRAGRTWLCWRGFFASLAKVLETQ